jgi:hypothetical protein
MTASYSDSVDVNTELRDEIKRLEIQLSQSQKEHDFLTDDFEQNDAAGDMGFGDEAEMDFGDEAETDGVDEVDRVNGVDGPKTTKQGEKAKGGGSTGADRRKVVEKDNDGKNNDLYN